MKGKKLIGFAIVILFIAVFFGCKSNKAPVEYVPPALSYSYEPEPEPVSYQPESIVPLTPYIVYRLGDNNRLPQNISKYQFVLAGKIVMESEYSQPNDRVLQGGRVKFEDVHIRESITIDDKTEGQATDIGIFGGEIVVSVCFEHDDLYRLSFATMAGNPDEYFYLRYSPSRSIAPYTDEKGSIEYGRDTYRLRFSGDKRPYLMIKLTHQDTVRLNSRTAPGRKID